MRLRRGGGTSPQRLAAIVALTLIAAASLAGGALVGRERARPAADVPEASRGAPVQRLSFLARLIPPAPDRSRPRGPRIPRSIDDLARRLPLERKVAQLFLVGFRGSNLTADVFKSLRGLDYGGLVIDRPNYKGVQLLGALAGEAQVISRQAKHVPPWVMAPQPGGDFNAFPDLPPSDAPADLRSPAQGGSQAAKSGATLRQLNVTGVLAPSLDVGGADDPAVGALAYSENPREVAAFADATVRTYRRVGVFSAAAHFPGLGAASQPTDQGPATVGLSLGELRRRDLVPFRTAIDAGVPAVVLSHALYTVDDFTEPGSLSVRVATHLLRGELHFRGVAITDDLADPAVTSQRSVPEAAVQALKAGADMLFISGPPSDQRAAFVAVLRAVRRKEISRRRLDEALFRTLIAKRRYKLIR
ncbi:MAG: glycoside hydrolase family 3 N-terminal domain-containing protein [Thermoleophilaceae bacterium]